MKPLAIDLFCGLGGWTDGLLAEGYDVIGFDITQHVYGEQRYPAQLVVQSQLNGRRKSKASASRLNLYFAAFPKPYQEARRGRIWIVQLERLRFNISATAKFRTKRKT